VKQLTERDQPLYLQSLQVELFGYTHVRAHEVKRQESNSWVIFTAANMDLPIGSPTDAVATETEISKEYWYNRPLPSAVAPTFVTCNLKREYELEVRVGLTYGSGKGVRKSSLNDRFTVHFNTCSRACSTSPLSAFPSRSSPAFIHQQLYSKQCK
jgi:hypothetical protein